MLNVNATSLEYTFLIMLSVLVVSRKDSIFSAYRTIPLHILRLLRCHARPDPTDQ